MSWASDTEALVGKTILSIAVDADNGRYLAFNTDQGQVVFEVDGDCCSHSYFHDFLGGEFLLGHKVTEMKSISLDDPPQEGYECLQAYGYSIRTDAGNAVLSFRNESNGYYGGWMEVANDPKLPAMQAITNNWQAD